MICCYMQSKKKSEEKSFSFQDTENDVGLEVVGGDNRWQ